CLMHLLFFVGVLWALWRLAGRMVPEATGLASAIMRTIARLVWARPVRKGGIAMVLFGWLISLTILCTLFGLSALARGDAGPICAALVLGLLVAGWYRLMRWQANRRYRPHDLPTRHRD